MGLADRFIAGVEHCNGFGAIPRASAFLLPGFGVFDVEHAAAFAAVEDVTTFHSFRRFVRSYEVERGFGRISYTKRAANPVVASDCRVLPEQLLSSSPVLISLALSLALASSGFAILLKNNKLKLAEGVGF